MSGINHAIANGARFDMLAGYTEMLDLSIATNKGRQQGLDEGIVEGFQQGFNEGKARGWDAGIEAGNVEITKAMGFIRKHVAEKEQLNAELQIQKKLIEQLNTKIRTFETEVLTLRGKNSKLSSTDSTLRRLVDALEGANVRLQKQVTSTDEKLQERTKQYTNQLWQYNRSLVVMNAVRGVLEDLTIDKSPHANHVRALFAEKYAQQVSQSLEKGAIKAAPDADNEFAMALPRTHEFITRLLGNSST